jgi:septin family protein
LSAQSDQGTALPFVLLVGNHSSGKSSFINYVLGRRIQTAGVAPTDDSFTIIAPGPVDRDQDGPSLIGDPDLGFGPLRQFGPTLMHHTQLKIRSDMTDQNNFIMVDSPGMIDAPANYAGMLQSSSSSHGSGSDAGRAMDRGYDFPGVVRWLVGA